MTDPTGFTSGKDIVHRTRIVKGEEPEGIDYPDGVFLELWEDQTGRRTWAISIFDDYRTKIGEGIHISISDEEAGWLQRHYTEDGDS